MTKLYNVELSNLKMIVYNENLPFKEGVLECNKDNVTDFIKFIRPALVFDTVRFTYLRELNSNEE